MIEWLIKKYNQLQCDHSDTRRWLAPTVLRNGKLATLVIKECKDCGFVFSYTAAYRNRLKN